MITRKNRLFIQEYIKCKNASEAIRRVYPAIKNPSVYGAVLLAKDSVKAEIEAYFKALDITEEQIIRSLTEIAKNGKVEANRIRCYELLARIKGLMKDTPQQNIALFTQLERELRIIQPISTNVNTHTT